MISIRIAGIEKRDGDIDESWINQEINRRKAAGQLVCVQVTIRTEALAVNLATPTCATGGGGGRLPTRDEANVLDLWHKHHLNTADFSSGNVVSFWKQLRRVT